MTETRPDIGKVAPRIVLFDLISGRIPGGHQEDYLARLEEAFHGMDVETIAIYRGGTAGRAPAARRPRAFEYLITFAGCVRGFRRSGPGALVFHTPEFRDILCLWAALALRPASSRTTAILVMRREAVGLIGRPGVKARVLGTLVRRMAAGGAVTLVSDSQPAADHWVTETGRPVRVIPLPPRPGTGGHDRPRSGPLRVGLVGYFRPEKGASRYAEMIGILGRLDPGVRVVCQLPAEPGPAEVPLVAAIQSAATGHGNVELRNGHFTTAEYDALLAGLDVVLLPYDVPTYGTGTSGVLFDAVEMGCIGLVTPIAWARQTYADHPSVVFMPGLGPAEVEAGLRVAFDRALSRRRDGSPSGRRGPEPSFGMVWRELVADTGSRSS